MIYVCDIFRSFSGEKRNISFIAKLLIFINFSLLEFPEKMALDEFLEQQKKANLQFMLMTSYPKTLTVC